MRLLALFVVSAAATTYKVDNSCAQPTRNDCSATIEKVLKKCAASQIHGTCVLDFAEGNYPLDQGLTYSGINQLQFEGDGVEIILEAMSLSNPGTHTSFGVPTPFSYYAQKPKIPMPT